MQENEFEIAYWRLKSALLIEEIRYYIKHVPIHHSLLKAGFNPGQSRVPAGSSDGGQWSGSGSSGSSGGSTQRTGNNSSGRAMHRVTEHSRAKITLHHPDNITETRTDGSRAWRNNNPGNIRSGGFAERHGAVGSAGGFAVFPDEQTGQAAHEALLRTSTYANLTVDEAVKRRSPPNENDTTRAQALIRQFSGLSGREKISDLNADQFHRFAMAIRRTEGWVPGEITRTRTP